MIRATLIVLAFAAIVARPFFLAPEPFAYVDRLGAELIQINEGIRSTEAEIEELFAAAETAPLPERLLLIQKLRENQQHKADLLARGRVVAEELRTEGCRLYEEGLYKQRPSMC